MEGKQSQIFICVQCGCHLENSFRFCPKCGMQLTSNMEVHGSGGGGNSQLRALTVPSASRTSLLQSNALAIPAPSPSSSFMSSRSSSTRIQTKLPGFELFKATKEKERRGFNIRGKDKKKRRVETQTVVILIGIMGENKKPKRCETLPVSISTCATHEDIVEAAVAKHVAFNRRFNGNLAYRLVFRDGSRANFIPGTNPPEPFTLVRYKEASGFGYSKITFYLRVKDFMTDLKEAIESDSNTDEEELAGEDQISGEDSSFTVTTSRAVFGKNETEKSSKTLLERQNDQSCQKPEEESKVLLMVNCPTCGVKYPVSDIEEHADLCADFVVDLPDPWSNDIMAAPSFDDQGRT